MTGYLILQKNHGTILHYTPPLPIPPSWERCLPTMLDCLPVWSFHNSTANFRDQASATFLVYIDQRPLLKVFFLDCTVWKCLFLPGNCLAGAQSADSAMLLSLSPPSASNWQKLSRLIVRATNEEVHAKIQQAIGLHKDLLMIVKRRKLQWCGHVSRSSGLAKTILQGTVKGERRQNRQRKRWKDIIREWTGLELGKSQRAVENRKKWRKLVAKSSVVPQPTSLLGDWWWWCCT